jgi:hypothetical protein
LLFSFIVKKRNFFFECSKDLKMKAIFIIFDSYSISTFLYC